MNYTCILHGWQHMFNRCPCCTHITTGDSSIGKIEVLLAPQGWQCPICKAVMSPGAAVCVNCTGEGKK